MQVLYSMDLTGQWRKDPEAIFLPEQRKASLGFPYARRIVSGVLQHKKTIDEAIEAHARHWSLSRMGVVERNVLRIATYEIIFCKDIPVKVSIHEALEVAKDYGTPGSGRFLNGVLDRIAKQDARIEAGMRGTE